MSCHQCGSALVGGANFCSECGVPVARANHATGSQSDGRTGVGPSAASPYCFGELVESRCLYCQELLVGHSDQSFYRCPRCDVDVLLRICAQCSGERHIKIARGPKNLHDFSWQCECGSAHPITLSPAEVATFGDSWQLPAATIVEAMNLLAVDCPSCHLHLARRVSSKERVASGLGGGLLFGRKARAQFQCLGCGYLW